MKCPNCDTTEPMQEYIISSTETDYYCLSCKYSMSTEIKDLTMKE